MTVQRHFHIRWLPTSALDWQRFDTQEEAETRANELVLPDETYTIELITGNCETCAALGPRPVALKKLKKRAAG
jgi:hypothetical protein